MIEGDVDAGVGDVAKLVLAPFGSIRGIIAWRIDDRYGFFFAKRINVARLRDLGSDDRPGSKRTAGSEAGRSEPFPAQPLDTATSASADILSVPSFLTGTKSAAGGGQKVWTAVENLHSMSLKQAQAVLASIGYQADWSDDQLREATPPKMIALVVAALVQLERSRPRDGRDS